MSNTTRPPQDDTPRPTAARPSRTLTPALAGLALCTLLPALGTSIANVALPAFAHAFDASVSRVQWIVLAYLLATTTLVVGAGRLGDVAGRQRVLMVGIGVFMGASLLCALAPGLAWLVAARALQGLGAAVLMALSMALVGDAVPQERSGSAMGLLGTLSAVGTALGPSLGGVLLAGFGWQALFLAPVPLAALALWLVARHVPAQPTPAGAAARTSFDRPGTALLAVALGAYALAMTLQRGHFGWRSAGLLLVAGLATWAFVAVEARAAQPLVRLALLRDPALRAGLVMGLLVSTVVMASLVVGPFYLAQALGLGAAAMGLVMSIGPAVVAAAGIPAGRLVDARGAQPTRMGGLVGMGAGALLLCLVPVAWGATGYALSLAILTAGYALFQAANNTAVMAEAGAAQRGVVSGLLNLSRNLGLVTGASALGAVFAGVAGVAGTGAGGAADAAAVAGGLHATFAVSTGLVVAAIALALCTDRARARPAA